MFFSNGNEKHESTYIIVITPKKFFKSSSYSSLKLLFMKKLPLRSLTSNELYTTSGRIVEACKTSPGENEYIATLCALVVKANSDLIKALGKALNSEFTPLLLQKDLGRDNGFIGLRDYISSYSHSSDPAKAAAGKNLSLIFDAAGNTIYTLGYAAKTAKLNALLTNLNASSAQKDLELIGAVDWFKQLQIAQNEFEKIYKTKIDTESAIDSPIVKDAKEQIYRYLKGLFSYIDINCELQSEKFPPLSDKIDEIITDVLTVIRSRETRKEKADKKQEKADV